VDLDHALDPKTGALKIWAQDIVDALDSYTEWSPSGEGVHIILLNSKPLEHGTRFPNLGIEIYDNERYFTVTGNRVLSASDTVLDRTKELHQFSITAAQDASIVKRILDRAKNDPKVARLWAGDATDYTHNTGQPDLSAADLALAGIIASISGSEKEVVDRVFRYSGLMRSKWLRDDYRAVTLDKAVMGRITQQAQASLDAGTFDLTDSGNARRLVKTCGDDIRYSREMGWLAWNGSQWTRDDAAPWSAARLVSQAIAAEVQIAPTKKRAQELLAWSYVSQSYTHTRAMVELCRQDTALRLHALQLDTQTTLLNTPGGVVDLYTGALTPHSRALLMTKITNAPYDPTAACPHWLAFLDKIFNGDQELISFIQRAVGYSLTGAVVERAFFILWGAGANGKTTFIETIAGLLGDYSQKTAVDTFLQKKFGNTTSTEVASLRGARFVHCAEVNVGSRLDESRIKEITGGDQLSARFMRQDPFNFTPECKVWMSTNHKPQISGTDDAIWSRVKLIPFTVQIPEAEQTPRDVMMETFSRESAGILNWAVKGCVEWKKHKLGSASAMSTATQEYREEEDKLGDFLSTCCEVDPAKQMKVDAQKLYEAYSTFTATNGEQPWTMHGFGRALSERGIAKKRATGGATVRVGIRLKHNL
jgi:putative DNA primase/helicase